MTHHRLKLILSILIANLVVLLSNSLALAAVRCETVFVNFDVASSVTGKETTDLAPVTALEKQESLRKVGELGNIYLDFISKTLNEKKISVEWVQKIEAATEAYFQAAGIRFEKKNFHAEQLVADQTHLGALDYPVYLIKGSDRPVDDNALLIRGFLTKTDLNVSLLYDPMMIFRFDNVLAAFDPRQQKITFTYVALTDRLFGGDDSLRHEMKHAFENFKIRRGEHSLARFELRGTPQAGDPYAGLFSLDELETHLIDLRGLTKIAPRREKALSSLSPETLSFLKSKRQKTREEKIRRLQNMIENSKQALNSLEHRLKTGLPDNGGWMAQNLAFLQFKNLEDTRYPKAAMLLSAGTETTKPEDLILQALQEITWAKARVLEIEKQMQKVTAN